MAKRVLQVRRAGLVPYSRAVEIQEDLVSRRRADAISDQLLLLEHPHVLTLGSSSRSENVLADPERRSQLGLDLVESGRGGDVTYHGPGQLVGYPILDLKPDRKDVHRYLRDLEEVLLRVLDSYGLAGTRAEGRTGVWTDRGKVAAIGVRISSRWISSHGFALNVATDLTYFDTIVPCGLADRSVTSLGDLLGRSLGMDEVMDRTVSAFAEVFERVPQEEAGLP